MPRSLLSPRAKWAALASKHAGIKVASAGEQHLTYVRCYKPARRVELLCKHLPSKANLVQAAHWAMALAKKGCLPAILPGQARSQSEFLGRCVDALKKVSPTAETDPKKLAFSEQQRLALALETAERQCYRCRKLARDPVPAADVLVTWAAVPEPYEELTKIEVPQAGEGKVFCASCVNDARVLLCPRCGGDDALVKARSDWACDVPGHHILTSTRCQRCDCHAIVTHSRQDKRNIAVDLWEESTPPAAKRLRTMWR